ncbi:MAG: hypothetical protein J2P27_03715, partial [Actinobacteria bacterium]|nr:hypothetical protein [Actinomycetota bacterium]
MPDFPRPSGWAASGMPDAALSALLAGRTLPADAPAPLRHVADVLAALQAEPGPDELAGRADALAEFRRRVGPSPQLHTARRWRPILITSLLSAKAAAGIAVAAVGVGGVATMAYTGKLPTAAQNLAHNTIGAPAASGQQDSKGHNGKRVGPNASGSAAFGLCTAWNDAKQNGTAAQKAVAFNNLAKAAGGAANINHYCAGVPHPGASEPS